MSYGKLALEASRKSGEYVAAGNREAWLSLFADDAVVQDPVGVSPLDPTGQGHKGKEAIAAFWDMIIAPGSIDFTILSSHPAGDECANVVHMENTMPGDMKIIVDMVVIYTANAEGKITSLKAYWDYDAVMAQMA